jgi:hypothetical protein
MITEDEGIVLILYVYNGTMNTGEHFVCGFWQFQYLNLFIFVVATLLAEQNVFISQNYLVTLKKNART